MCGRLSRAGPTPALPIRATLRVDRNGLEAGLRDTSRRTLAVVTGPVSSGLDGPQW